MQTFTLPIPKSISNRPSKVSMNAYTKSIEVYSYIHLYTHKQAIYGYTSINIYEGEREGGRMGRVGGGFFVFMWKRNNSIFSLFYGRVWEGLGERVAKYRLMGI
jgi:hypothetical protein